MKSKRFLALLLTGAMLLSTLLCGAAFADGDASSDIDAQLGLMYSKFDALKQTSGGAWYYTVTDLDHDGLLELIAASQHQMDRSTNLKVWELSADKSALTECSLAKDPEESFPDILTDVSDTFHDTKSDTWYYLFYDNIVLSANEVYTSKSAYNLKNGVISYEAFAVEHTLAENGWRSVSHTDANGISISPEQYNAAGVNAFAGAERSSTSFDWFKAEDASTLSRLADSYAVFAGRKSPTEVFPVPKPALLEQPVATPAPAATPAPTAAPAAVSTPLYLTVTKNPTNENKSAGQTAMFVACANAYESLNWTMVSPNGGEYSTQSFAYMFADAPVSGEYSTTLSIGNVAGDMSGWGAYCTFYYKGQTARTSTAYMYVEEKRSPVVPSGTYTATVTDYAFSTVTLLVEGGVSITISWDLCDVEGNLYYGAPAYVQWNGQNVTYCYIKGETNVQPVYGSMSGTIYKDTAYTVYVVLQDGSSWTLPGTLVNIYGGSNIDGASCTVYYTDYPSNNNIYQIDAYGYEIDEPEWDGGWAGSNYYDDPYEYGGWAGSNYYANEPGYGNYGYETGNSVYGLPTHDSYNADGSTYEAFWCPFCGTEVSLAMGSCPGCGTRFA